MGWTRVCEVSDLPFDSRPTVYLGLRSTFAVGSFGDQTKTATIHLAFSLLIWLGCWTDYLVHKLIINLLYVIKLSALCPRPCAQPGDRAGLEYEVSPNIYFQLETKSGSELSQICTKLI